MTINDEDREHELDTSRITELLTVARLIGEAADRTLGDAGVGSGVIPCPVCGTGAIAYETTRRSPARRQIHAVCSTSGCIRFAT
jgi:hypothetical protein